MSTPWESDAWIAYCLPYWLRAVFATVLLLAVLATVATTRSSRRRNEKMHDPATQGTKVRGLITEAIATGTEIQGMPRVHRIDDRCRRRGTRVAAGRAAGLE